MTERIAHVEFSVAVPTGGKPTDEQVGEWLHFFTTHSGSLSLSNPLQLDQKVVPNTFDWDWEEEGDERA